MRSVSLPKHKLKALSFADALRAPTPEEQKAREQVTVEARKRRHKKDPEEGKGGKKDLPVMR